MECVFRLTGQQNIGPSEQLHGTWIDASKKHRSISSSTGRCSMGCIQRQEHSTKWSYVLEDLLGFYTGRMVSLWYQFWYFPFQFLQKTGSAASHSFIHAVTNWLTHLLFEWVFVAVWMHNSTYKHTKPGSFFSPFSIPHKWGSCFASTPCAFVNTGFVRLLTNVI